MNEKAFINLVTFWRDVEALSPQEIPKKAPNDQKEPTRDWGTDSNGTKLSHICTVSAAMGDFKHSMARGG